MRAIGQFISGNAGLLFFGFLLTFFSSFGQTFLISLYVPEIGSVFDLSNTELSSLYAVATLGSAFTLPWVGRYVDVVSLWRFTLGVLLGLAVSLGLLSTAPHPLLVLLGFFGLRLFGQGLMSHTSISTMARAYEADRGKAISLATLGHPAGEASLPLLIAFIIGWAGWRGALQYSAAAIVLLVIPAGYFLLRAVPQRVLNPKESAAIREVGTEDQKTIKNPFRLLRTREFWIITPAVFLLGFLNTAIFFFQVQIGASKGWDAEWVAGSLAAFALASALGMFFAGPIVDRLTARQVYPFFLITYIMGLVLLSSSSARLIYPASLFLMGLSHGAGSTIKNAVLAEIYGVQIIGSVRSLFTTMVVFSTALGPVSFGFLIDNGFSYNTILLASAAMVALGMLWSLRILSPFTRRRWVAKVRGRKMR